MKRRVMVGLILFMLLVNNFSIFYENMNMTETDITASDQQTDDQTKQQTNAAAVNDIVQNQEATQSTDSEWYPGESVKVTMSFNYYVPYPKDFVFVGNDYVYDFNNNPIKAYTSITSINDISARDFHGMEITTDYESNLALCGDVRHAIAYIYCDYSGTVEYSINMKVYKDNSLVTYTSDLIGSFTASPTGFVDIDIRYKVFDGVSIDDLEIKIYNNNKKN